MSEPQQEAEKTATQIAAVPAPHSKPSTAPTVTVSRDVSAETTEPSEVKESVTASSSEASSVIPNPTCTSELNELATNKQKIQTISEVCETTTSGSVAVKKLSAPESSPHTAIEETPASVNTVATATGPVPQGTRELTASLVKTGTPTETSSKPVAATPIVVTSNVATVINPNSHVEHWNLDSFLPGEDKNPFSDISEEHLNQLADALSTEDVTNLLQTDFGTLDTSLVPPNVDPATAVTNKSRDSLNSDDSLKLDLFESDPALFDEAAAHKIIRDGVHEHDLVVMSAAFSDHAYAIPAHNDPSLAPTDPSLAPTDPSLAVPPLQTCTTTESQTEYLSVDADGEEPSRSKGRQGDDSPTNYPKRRSVRISDQEQKDLAEKIRQENRRKEREAKEALIAKNDNSDIKTGKNDETEEDGSESCSDTQKSKRGRKLKPTAKAQLFRESRAARLRKTDDSTDEQTTKDKRGRGRKPKEETTEDSSNASESPKKVPKSKAADVDFEDGKEVKKTEESSGDEEEVKAKGGRTRNAGKKGLKEDAEDTDLEKKTAPKKRRGRPPNKLKKEKVEKEMNGAEIEIPKRKGRPPGKKKKPVVKQEIASSGEDEPLDAGKGKGKNKESDGESSSAEETTKRKKGKKSPKVVKKGKKSKDQDQESEEESEDDTLKKGKKKGKGKKIKAEESESEEEEKLSKKGKKKVALKVKEEESESEEEEKLSIKGKKKVGPKVKEEESESEEEEKLPKKGKKKAGPKVKEEESSAEEEETIKKKKGKKKTGPKVKEESSAEEEEESRKKKGKVKAKKDADESDTEKQTPKSKKKKLDDDTPKRIVKKGANEAGATPKTKKAVEKVKKEKTAVGEESEEDVPLQHLKGGRAKPKEKGEDDKQKNDEDVDFGAEFRYPSKQSDPSHKHRRKSHRSVDTDFIDPSMTELFKPDVKDEKTTPVETVSSGEVKVQSVEAKVQSVETKVQSVDAKVQSVEAKIQSVDAKVQSVDAKVQKVEMLEKTSDVNKENPDVKVGDVTKLDTVVHSEDSAENKAKSPEDKNPEMVESVKQDRVGDLPVRKPSTESHDSRHSSRKDSVSSKRDSVSSIDSRQERTSSVDSRHETKRSIEKLERKHSMEKHERKHSVEKRERKHSMEKHERKHSMEKQERKHSMEKHDRKHSIEKSERKHSVDSETRLSTESLKRRHSLDKHAKKLSKEKGDQKNSVDEQETRSKEELEKVSELRKTRGKKLKHRKGETDEKDDEEQGSDESGELSFEDDENDSDWEPKNDPDTLYCICRKPHNSRFMICCDNCEEWYHGSCVGITKTRGKDMEKNNEEYICPVCTKAMKTGSTQTSEAESTKTPTKTAEPVKSEVKATPGSISKVSSTTVTPTKDGQLLGEIKKRSAKETEEKKKQGFKAFRNMGARLLKEQKMCIRKDCTKDVRPGTIYCSDDCISQHAQHSMKLIRQDRELIAISKGLDLDTLKKPMKLHVLERKSGRILSGNEGPTEANLETWLKEHPTFQVIRPKVKTKLPSPYLLKLQKERKERERQKEELKRKEKEKERERLRRKREWEKEKERARAEKLKKESEQKNKAVEGPDPIRLNVRKSLRDALANRTKDADDMMYSTNEIKALALKIEEALFHYFEDTGHKYKNKYRTLVFNIRDPKNKGLFRKILTGQIKPSKLITMTHDDLASKELAQWREKETKHTLELIETAEKKAQKEPVHIRKKTHKGEVELEDEDLSTLAETLLDEKPSVLSSTEEVKKDNSEADDQVSEVIVDTTDQHRAHLFDLNCKICTGKQAPMTPEPEVKKVKVEHKVKESTEVLKEKQQLTGKEHMEAEANEVIKEVMDVIHKEEEKPEYVAPSSSGQPTAVIVRSPDSALSSGLDAKPKFKPQGPRLWKGFVAMQDLAKFFTSAYKVSGPTNDLNLPDTVAVCGRIAPDQMWDYLAKIRQGGSRDICIIRFIPGSDDEKVAYIHLYSYLNSRGRCGVVGNAPKHVKDFYIVPLASHGHIPRVLKPFDGPGLENNRPHMLLGIIIRQKLKRASQSDTAAATAVLPKQKEEAPVAKKARVQGSMMAPKDPRLERSSRLKTFSPSTSDSSVIQYKPTKLEELKASSSSSSTSSSPDLGSISKDPIVKAFTDPKTAEDSPKLSSSLPYSPGGGDDDTEDSPYDPTDNQILMTASSSSSSQPPSTSTATTTSSSSSTTTTTNVETTKMQASSSKKKLKQLSDTEAITGIKVDEIVDKIAKSTDPAQITAMMVTILACASDAAEQKVLLAELTNRVETRKQDLLKQTLGIEVKSVTESQEMSFDKEKMESKSDSEKSGSKASAMVEMKVGLCALTKSGDLEAAGPQHSKLVDSEMKTPSGFYTGNSGESDIKQLIKESDQKSMFEIVTKVTKREELVKKSETVKDISKDTSKDNTVLTAEAITSGLQIIKKPDTEPLSLLEAGSEMKEVDAVSATSAAASESLVKSIPISIAETKTGDMPLALQALMKDVMGESAVRLQKPRLPARFAVTSSKKVKDSEQKGKEEKTDADKPDAEKDSKSSEKKDKIGGMENLIPGLGYLDTDSDEEYSGSPHLFMNLGKTLDTTAKDSSANVPEKPEGESKKMESSKESKDEQIELSKSDMDMRAGQLPEMPKSFPKDLDLRPPPGVEDIDERIKPRGSIPMDKDDRVLGQHALPGLHPPAPLGPPAMRTVAPDGFTPVVRPPPIRIPQWGPGNPPPPGVDDPISPEMKVRPPPGVAMRFRGPRPRPPFAAPILPPRLGFPFIADSQPKSAEDSTLTKKDSAIADSTVSSTVDPKKDLPLVKEESNKDESKDSTKKDEGNKKAKKDKSGKELKSKNKNKNKKALDDKTSTEDVDERILPPIIPGVPMTVSLPGIPVAISVVPPKPSGLEPVATTEVPAQWPGQTDIDQRMFGPGMPPAPMMGIPGPPVASIAMTVPNSPMLPSHMASVNSPIMPPASSPMMASMSSSPRVVGPAMMGMNIPPNAPPICAAPPMPITSVQPNIPPVSSNTAWIPGSGPPHAAPHSQHPGEMLPGPPLPEHPLAPPPHPEGLLGPPHPPDHPYGPQPAPRDEPHGYQPSGRGGHAGSSAYKDVDFRQQDVDLRSMNAPPMPPIEYQSSPNTDGSYPHKRPYPHELPNEPHGKRPRGFGGPGGFRSDSPHMHMHPPPQPARDSKPPSLMSLKFDNPPQEPECSQSPNEIDFYEQQEYIGGYYQGVKNPRGGGWNYKGARGRSKFQRDFPPGNSVEESYPPEQEGEDRLAERHEDDQGYGRDRRQWGPRHDRRGGRDGEPMRGYHHDDSRHREGFHRGRRRDARDYRR